MLYRALAAPGGVEEMLAAPDDDRSYADPFDALTHACAYWAALLHLLTFSFGWTEPGRGLLSWVAAGYPEDDPRLALLNATYGRDRQLGALVGWLLRSPYASSGVWHELAMRRGLLSSRPDLDQMLQLAQTLPAPSREVHSPGSDGDPLHLSAHLADAFNDPGAESATLSITSVTTREASLTCSSLSGWYEALCRHGDDLQSETDRSWRIEVFVRPVGLMGTYGRSRSTNVWFSGRHQNHTWGTPPTA